jgi:hypothetical protein
VIVLTAAERKRFGEYCIMQSIEHHQMAATMREKGLPAIVVQHERGLWRAFETVGERLLSGETMEIEAPRTLESDLKEDR